MRMESTVTLPRVGCVCTLRLPYANDWQREKSFDILHTFISHHLSKGFVHLIFFFDDAKDPSRNLPFLQQQVEAGKVSVFVRGHELENSQRAVCSLYHKLSSYKDEEVPARQQLNAEYALLSARSLNLDWLLHLDIDELFYTNDMFIHEHFQQLTELGVGHITYANHEGIPEKPEIGNYFKEVTLFRRNHHTVPMTPQAEMSLKFFEQRTNNGQYMLFYDNGKSAVRVIDGVLPISVHAFRIPETVGLSYCQTFRDMRNPNLNCSIYRECNECILHYPVCGSFWLLNKYETLGQFKSSWMGDKVPIAPSFHLDCRDAYLQGIESLSNIFKTQVLLDTASANVRQIVDDLLLSGVCFRTTDIAAGIKPSSYKPKLPISLTSQDQQGAAQSTNERQTGAVSDASKAWLIANIAREYL